MWQNEQEDGNFFFASDLNFIRVSRNVLANILQFLQLLHLVKLQRPVEEMVNVLYLK